MLLEEEELRNKELEQREASFAETLGAKKQEFEELLRKAMDDRDEKFRSIMEHKDEEYKEAMAQAVAMAKEVAESARACTCYSLYSVGRYNSCGSLAAPLFD